MDNDCDRDPAKQKFLSPLISCECLIPREISQNLVKPNLKDNACFEMLGFIPPIHASLSLKVFLRFILDNGSHLPIQPNLRSSPSTHPSRLPSLQSSLCQKSGAFPLVSTPIGIDISIGMRYHRGVYYALGAPLHTALVFASYLC